MSPLARFSPSLPTAAFAFLPIVALCYAAQFNRSLGTASGTPHALRYTARGPLALPKPLFIFVERSKKLRVTDGGAPDPSRVDEEGATMPRRQDRFSPSLPANRIEPLRPVGRGGPATRRRMSPGVRVADVARVHAHAVAFTRSRTHGGTDP